MVSKSDRAKQFLPFDSLKGLQEALKEKELEYTEKIELSEEQIEKISQKLNSIKIGDEIKVTYYENRGYKNIKGNVNKINNINKHLIIEDIKINFEDILKIEK